jgi:hypothetical protein
MTSWNKLRKMPRTRSIVIVCRTSPTFLRIANMAIALDATMMRIPQSRIRLEIAA